MKIDPKAFRVAQGEKVKLAARPTTIRPFYSSHAEYADALAAHVTTLRTQQEKLYATGQNALLLVFQAMDAAGKDGTISHLLSGVNPQGCDVHSFTQPSAEELAHDFLWRAACHLPARGHIGVFNRSYYEDVLVVRVHPELLGPGSRAAGTHTARQGLWRGRYRSIVDFEKHLDRNGTRVVKFFLHVSKDERRARFLARIDEPAHNWKFHSTDIAARESWDSYMTAYERCLRATSTKTAPWYIIPADDKQNARLIVGHIVVDTMRRLGLHFPVLDDAALAALQESRALLESEPARRGKR